MVPILIETNDDSILCGGVGDVGDRVGGTGGGGRGGFGGADGACAAEYLFSVSNFATKASRSTVRAETNLRVFARSLLVRSNSSL